VARALLEDAGLAEGELWCSHWTTELRRRFHHRQLVHNPYFLMRPAQ
jgi:hypothetical protein